MENRRRPALQLAIALTIALHTNVGGQQQAQAPLPPATGAITGVVIDTSTQKPIAGAVVQLSGSAVNIPANPNARPPGTVSVVSSASGNVTTLEAPPEPFRPQRQLTDESGRFLFMNLPGSMGYSLVASRYGYFDAAFGRRGMAGTIATSRRIVLAHGQWFRDARIEMVRPSAISGRVFDESGDPVVGVAVKLYTEIFVGGTRQTAAGLIVLTDDRGVYRIGNLTPGRYLVAVPSVQHAVPEATTTAELLGLSPQAAALAEPPARRDPSFAAGNYRTILAQNAPVPAPSANGRPQVYPTTFHPAARSAADATAIQLQSGDDRQGVDIQLRPSPMFRISGRLDGPPEAAGGLSLRLLAAGLESLGRGSEAATALVAGDGSFSFVNVPNGAYTIVGSRTITEYTSRPPGSPAGVDSPQPPGVRFTSMSSNAVDSATAGTMLSRYTYQGNLKYQARQAVTVNGRDVLDLLVPMQAGITMRGEIVIESSKGAGASQVFLSLRAESPTGDPLMGQPSFDRTAARTTTGGAGDNEFVLEGLLPGSYLLRAPNIKSILWNGRDYLDTPFDTTTGKDITGVVVTLTDQLTTVTGTIRDRSGQVATNTAVIAFPADRTKWSGYGIQPARIRSSPGSTLGLYTLYGLPAGDYLIVAVDDDFAARWKEPGFLEAASRTATRVTLTWGGSQTLDLVLQEIR